ncbi:hypothetical protein MMC10_004281 [Thelotrema lepadinum]|nr:hypothetical protein [Thelotrema lepadinum]
MTSTSPFKIAIPDTKLQRLKQKLALTDFPGEIVNSENPWARGVPLSEIKRLVHYWESDFDWREAEAKLNHFRQYTTNIGLDGFGMYNVHFIHEASAVPSAIPLLFLHGWPGSFIEVTKMLPELVIRGEQLQAFHVVAPSLINFGFSSANTQRDFHIDQHAEVYHKLMLSLGYSEYVVQGGDLGYIIARFIALSYGPAHVKIVHANSAFPAAPTETSHPELLAIPPTNSDVAGLQRTELFNKELNGYLRLLSTKPQTIAYSLSDSPVGLLAWIYEKLHDWSDSYAWTDDEILTWVSLYYFSTSGPAASSHVYYEMEHRSPPAFSEAQVYTAVPLGIARFEHDLLLLPSAWNATLGPIARSAVFEHGGHFATWERPEAIVSELRAMLGKGEAGEGCVSGRGGYVS